MKEDVLKNLYINKKLSSREISLKLKCSEGKVNYWISKYNIPKRSISDAVYTRLNPNGDPFEVKKVESIEDALLVGIGLGLFWGEGNKKDFGTLRLGNSDPDLMRLFLYFLEKRYQIKKHRLRFGLQLFSDMNIRDAEKFWLDYLHITSNQLYKTVVSVSGKTGTYREKTKYGVLTLYFHNKKLRDLVIGEIDNLSKIDYHSDVLLKEEKPM